MALPEIRKQISIFLPLSDWRRLRSEAIHRGVPMTDICRKWLEPNLERLRRREGRPGDPDSALRGEVRK
jgi:hypothetical protein